MFNYLARALCFSIAFFAFVNSPTVQAQIATGVATQYTIQVMEVALCKSSACTSASILGSSTTSFDIASSSAGSDVGSYAETSGLPLGTTFSHIRVTMSRTITIDGSITNAGNLAGIANTTCRTDTANGAGATGAAATAADGIEGTGVANSTQDLFVPTPLSFAGGTLPTNASYTNEGIALPMGATSFVMTKALAAPVTIDEEEPEITASFGTQTALGAFNGGANNCKMVPQPPSVTISIN